MSGEGTRSIKTQSPLFLSWAEEPEKAFFFKSFLCALLKEEGEEEVEKAKEEERSADDWNSFQDIRTAFCSE